MKLLFAYGTLNGKDDLVPRWSDRRKNIEKDINISTLDTFYHPYDFLSGELTQQNYE